MIIPFLIWTLASQSPSDLDSNEWAKRIKNGNHKAFKQFFDAHHGPLMRFLLSKKLAEQDAKDLIQEAFIYIWDHRNGIDESKSLRGYLFTIAYTRMLNHLRDTAKFDSYEPKQESVNQINPGQQLITKELKEAITWAIEAMPERRGMIFDMCFIQEFTYREAAEALDISIKTVENHMGLAFKDIRSALSHFVSDK